MAELNKSLTAMDWLPRLNAPRELAAGGGLWLDAPPPPLDTQTTHVPELVQADSSTPSPPTTNGKPPYSYASLITMAINSSCRRKMTLAEIYHWITDNFTFYKQATSGWKNSVRHNLSLNKCFKKVARTKDDPGKGSYWAIDPSYTADEPVTRRKKQSCPRFNPYLTASSALRGDPMAMLPGKTMLNPAAAMMVAGVAAAGHHNKGGSGVFNPWSHQVNPDAWLPSQQFWNSNSTTEGFMMEGQAGVNVPVGSGENEPVLRGSSVDGITMNDCDLRLLNNLTPEVLREYADLLTSSSMMNQNIINSIGLSTSTLQLPRSVSGPPTSIPSHSFTPLTTNSTPSYIDSPVNTTPLPLQASGETLESLVADPLLVSNAVPPDDVLRSPQQVSSPGELTLDGSFSLSGHSDLNDSTTSLSALSQTVSALSHGSGGTVTIMRREQLSEPLTRLLSPMTPPEQHQAAMPPCDDDGLDSVLEDGLKDMQTAIQVGLITGSGPHSDDEEITDEFNWEKLL